MDKHIKQESESTVASSKLPQNPNIGVNYENYVLKEIWFAGGCFWGVEAYFARIYGVAKTTVGYADGKTETTSYRELFKTDHAETVQVSYDPQKVSLQTLLEYLFNIIDPTSIDKQGNDSGRQYRTGIYFKDDEDSEIIKIAISKQQQKYKLPIATDVKGLNNYILAEDYHQDYLEKNPNGYCHVDFSSLRKSSNKAETYIYKKPAAETIKASLTETQFKVTQQNSTEPPFQNEYWDSHARGIYVDIVTGEPLFVSSDKFDSGCGWPSFSKPISEELIVKQVDNTHGKVRSEVRSRTGDSHLGHVFTDGPKPEGLRYCINSASLKFIALEDMQKTGYGHLITLVI